MVERVSVFKYTEDDWYPPFYLRHNAEETYKLVEVSLLEYSTKLGTFCVCAWGEDDFGLEKEFSNLEEAKQVFEDIISQKLVSTEYLRNLGFQGA